MSPTQDDWHAAPTLNGQFLRLEALHERHAQSLARHATEQTLTFLVSGGPAENTATAWGGFIARLNARPNRRNWAVVMTSGPLAGEVAGRISYSDIRYADRWVEIGTMLTPPFQGGAANPEAKRLLLTRAFEVLGANRVQFKTDTRNARSRAAMRKLDAREEGTLRAFQVRADGAARDSVMFSILRQEWPQVRRGLHGRLTDFRMSVAAATSEKAAG